LRSDQCNLIEFMIRHGADPNGGFLLNWYVGCFLHDEMADFFLHNVTTTTDTNTTKTRLFFKSCLIFNETTSSIYVHLLAAIRTFTMLSVLTVNIVVLLMSAPMIVLSVVDAVLVAASVYSCCQVVVAIRVVVVNVVVLLWSLLSSHCC
jgi:hypothetical protein